MPIIIPILLILTLILAILERKGHQRNIDSIPIRVNVNGIRGKSTATRLITGILAEAGIKVVGKTTGTSARLIYWDKLEEDPILRRPEGPNIREQKMVVSKAAELGAEALVSECMAVNPDYQIVFQEQMLQANIGVIVNVLEDHMDVMGPTLDEVAEAFTATIPYNGYLIISDGPYVEFFKRKANERGSAVIVAENSEVSDEYLKSFGYVIFPENVALALAVARVLNIDENTAKRGMLNSHPDPGVLKIINLDYIKRSPTYFVNGFAANDASSTINILKRVKELGYPVDSLTVIMNCRPDRVDRTEQFANDVLPFITSELVILIGESTEPIANAYREGKLKTKKLLNLEGYSAEESFRILMEAVSTDIIYGVGNIHGVAEVLIDILENYSESSYSIDEIASTLS